MAYGDANLEKPKEEIIISDPERLAELEQALIKGGPQNLHILSDFDRTLTKAFIDGQYIPSLISVLRDHGYLTPDYPEQAHALFNKYHAIELDPKVSLADKKRAMLEWWTAHFDLLIRSGLNKKDLSDVVESNQIVLRDGFKEFSELLKAQNIPLVVLSSSGLGGEIIAMLLAKAGALSSNVHIVSNEFEWDAEGKAIGVKKPIIHSMNKDEAALKDFSFFKDIKDRKNVLLMGDNLEDTAMITGFSYDNLVRIGFMNERTKENLEHYQQKYEVVVLNDGSLAYVNDLLKKINQS
ncbi:MAG: hypothetical protein PHV78_00130 [Patescibacteria group bacterium]|nr:hypothetical protein [Patescibacteria group bacterium]MDD5121415.1 hypothetical protein [Patescibacteria group bacterium]MDD5221859.1 hypothetical protein [Patescibacteria group bacterium]MDD5395666.1 hypothetical protein [Patescibacteria group bacterium]